MKNFKEIVRESVLDNKSKYEKLALTILANPELGYQEKMASQLLTETLADEGFEILQPYGGLETAFRAETSKGANPAIFFLAEYDALPGVGHGCGHNLIGSAAVAAAIAVSKVIKDLGGSVGVIGTPAEEYMGEEEGKVKLLRSGGFDDLTATIMLHPNYSRQVIGRDLGFVACEFMFYGKAAHASADPWKGRNALDGLIATFNNINALRQHVESDIRIHGIITDGGKAPNIIPDFSSAQFMVRAADPERLEQTYRRVCECAEAGAKASGTRLEIKTITKVLNTNINKTLNTLVEKNYEEIGMPISEPPYLMDASSDFGNVSHKIPSVMFMIESHTKGIPWHSEEVAKESGEEKALNAMINGACVMAGIAVDLLSNQEIMKEMQEDFK